MKEEDKMNRTLDKVRRLRPIDDVLFEKIIEDKGVCEEILRVILEDEELQVLTVTSQSSVKNLYGRSVRLDAFCKLGNGTLCNIEVQKSDNDDHVKRVRYNASCITANNTEVGERFIHVPDVMMVYISMFDIFGKGKTIYHCRTIIEETNDTVENGLREIYVNTAIHDGSTIAELMECFMQEQVENKKFPLLSSKVWYFKNDEGGIGNMCKIVDDYAKELMAEEDLVKIKSLFYNGASVEMVIASFQNISEEDIRRIYEEVLLEKKN